jgi:hypothetical protein
MASLLRFGARVTRAAGICAGVIVILSASLAAHDAHVVGAYRLEIGWAEEPAFAGMRNAVTVEITDAASRAPVTDLGGGSLAVEVTFGDERLALPLGPSPETKNTFRAWILPTRPGTYGFHITGRVKGQSIDLRATCSPKTFDCVITAADIQFPAKDPSTGDLAERIERSAPRAERALALAGRAQTIAVAALGVAVLGAVGLVFRRRARGD